MIVRKFLRVLLVVAVLFLAVVCGRFLAEACVKNGRKSLHVVSASVQLCHRTCGQIPTQFQDINSATVRLQNTKISPRGSLPASLPALRCPASTPARLGSEFTPEHVLLAPHHPGFQSKCPPPILPPRCRVEVVRRDGAL